MTRRARRDPRYLKRGAEPDHRLGERRTVVAERDYLFTLYAVDVAASDGTRGRHVLAVPVAVGAVSFTVGMILSEEDSLKADVGDFEAVASLANAVQGDHRRFRTFPANELGRFVL